MNNPPPPPPPPNLPNGLPPLPNADDVPELIDCIQQSDERHVEGVKMKINAILNIPLVFLDWTFEKSKFKDAKSDEFIRIHFMHGGSLCYIETASGVIMWTRLDCLRRFQAESGRLKRLSVTKPDHTLSFSRQNEN